MRAAVTEAPSAGTWLTARRAFWLLAIVAAVVVALLAVRLTQSFIARNAVSNKIGIPVVSVTEVGRSTMLTLVIVPAVFTVLDDIERWAAPRAGKLLAEPAGSAIAQQ